VQVGATIVATRFVIAVGGAVVPPPTIPPTG
jgi:hypothetical protein